MQEAQRLGVEFFLGRVPTQEELIELEPDCVIVAVGAHNRLIPVEGAQLPHVLDAWKVLSGRQMCGGEVIVIGRRLGRRGDGGTAGVPRMQYHNRRDAGRHCKGGIGYSAPHPAKGSWSWQASGC